MTVIESGVIAGGLAGAIIGGVVCKSLSILAIVGGAAAGTAVGGIAGFAYAFVIVCLLSVVGALWHAARGRLDELPDEADMERMTSISAIGAFIGVMAALVIYLSAGWLHALLVALAIASATALEAVVRCEMR
jgi:hypothetical protein